ncbi:HD domain-containing protein [Dongia soli]|uniref:HD domain-containing protein n=1 Tax=Dongia soli TaxID=600628 RepID=A0ABU5E990_9PROT|nr:HD domain-containing protein [Dongia soli]MDY0882925.1 HD domain-containing protein [Dongia soli]
MSLETVNFIRMDEGTEAEYQLLDRLYKVHEEGLAGNAIALLDRLAGDKMGYRIDRYQHSLQSATRALRDGADEESIVCALLHDIGDTLAPHNHSDLAAAILQPYVSEDNHWVIKHHGIFQGYYFWHFVGGDRHAREQYRGHPLFDRCARFCERWDQVSFDPDYETQPIETFMPMVERIFARQPFGDHIKVRMADLA